jgi:ribosomal protein S18 acetylase RimI-like enzyme
MEMRPESSDDVAAVVRDATADEALALESLQRRASDVWPEYREPLAEHPEAIAPPHQAIAEGRVRVIADGSGSPLGFSVVLPVRGGRCELDDLFVEPDSMRRGIGRLLVHDLAERAAEAGATQVDVIANPNAVGFYARLGFTITGQASTQFGDAPRMTLDLCRAGEHSAPDPAKAPPGVYTDSDLYSRGAATLLATWEEDARGARGAALERFAGVAAAVFPHEPERTFFNNALLARGLASLERRVALDAIEAAYADAGVDRFAAWVHEDDRAMQEDLERRGYRFDTTTRAMGMALADARLEQPRIDLAPPDWQEHLRVNELPADFLARVGPAAYRIAIARLDGESVATAIAFELDGDCGIYNVGTLEHARRRGLASGVTAALLRDALERGCTTASLQATPMAERLYAALGFRNLGRLLEYVPGTRGGLSG